MLEIWLIFTAAIFWWQQQRQQQQHRGWETETALDRNTDEQCGTFEWEDRYLEGGFDKQKKIRSSNGDTQY